MQMFWDCTGSITTSASGGTGTLSFLWSANASGSTNPIVNGLCSDNYTVTASDANACADSVNVLISQPATPLSSIASVIDDVTCNEEMMHPSAIGNGGTAPYSYVYLMVNNVYCNKFINQCIILCDNY